jgi:hypothetical protein
MSPALSWSWTLLDRLTYDLDQVSLCTPTYEADISRLWDSLVIWAVLVGATRWLFPRQHHPKFHFHTTQESMKEYGNKFLAFFYS